jgi:hypothetical protein
VAFRFAEDDMSAPPIPDTFAFADDRPLSVHQAGLGGWLRYNSAIVLLAVIAGLLGLGLLSLHFIKGPQTNTLLPGSLIALAAVPLLLWGFVRYGNLITEVRLYPGGVLWLDHGRWRGAEWDEILDLYRTEIYVNGSAQTKQVVIKTRDGKEAIFTHALAKWGKMAERMQMETTVRRGAELLAAYEAGETVEFADKVGVNERGLVFGGKLMRWDNIRDIQMGNGTIMITPNKGIGEVRYLSFGELPNYLVFLKRLEIAPAPQPKPFS